jgi:small subunit ribosomal protein S20
LSRVRRTGSRRDTRIAEDQGTDMANTPSARKASRKIASRTQVNTVPRTRMRTFIRRVEEAIASGDKGAARDALRAAQPHIMKAAAKHLIHRNAASRKISRLSHRVEALA